MKRVLLIVATLLFLLSAKVAVCVEPLKYIVDRVSGGELDVTVIVKEGKSPAEVGYSASTVRQLSRAEVFFYVPVPACRKLAGDVSRAMPRLRVVDLSENLKLRKMVKGYSLSKGKPVPVYEKKGSDPHVWTSLSNDFLMAEKVCEVLSEIFPERSAEFHHNLEEFGKELKIREERIKKKVAKLRHKSFVIYHPCLGYFADEFGLTQLPLEVQGKELRAKDLSLLLKLAKEEGINVVIVTPPFSEKLATKVARTLNARVERVNHLSLNFLDELERVPDLLMRTEEEYGRETEKTR